MFRLLCRGPPRPAARRAVRQYNQNYFQNLQPPVSRFKKTVTGAFWLVSASAFAYYMWWPKHTFPSPVAAILRKGILAESDKGEQDFQLALKYYLQALEECRAQKLDLISDEYTGVQLKIAEMYERLSMDDNAAFVYNEIATQYLSVLKAPKNSPAAARVKGIDHRAHLIQKDLRVALKLVELNQNNPLLLKAILITHLLIAQEEVNKKLGAGKASLFFSEAPAESEGGALSSSTISASTSDTSASTSPSAEPVVIEANPEAWHPFAEEFFHGLEMLSAICVSVGDFNAASNINLSMTSKMLLAGVPPDMLLHSQCNTASLLYSQAWQLQAQEQAMRQKFALDAGVDYQVVKALHDPLQPPVSDDEAKEVRQKIAAAVLTEDKAKYEEIVANRKKLMAMVIATYDSVLNGAKQLPAAVLAEELTIPETVALATYGLGVVNLHLGEYDKAERLLREARVRSRACNYDTLILEVERELGKLQDERRVLKQRREDV